MGLSDFLRPSEVAEVELAQLGCVCGGVLLIDGKDEYGVRAGGLLVHSSCSDGTVL